VQPTLPHFLPHYNTLLLFSLLYYCLLLIIVYIVYSLYQIVYIEYIVMGSIELMCGDVLAKARRQQQNIVKHM